MTGRLKAAWAGDGQLATGNGPRVADNEYRVPRNGYQKWR